MNATTVYFAMENHMCQRNHLRGLPSNQHQVFYILAGTPTQDTLFFCFAQKTADSHLFTFGGGLTIVVSSAPAKT